MKFVKAVVGCMLLVVASFANAEPDEERFYEGVNAYENGDYKTAMALWRPLAEQGFPEPQTNIGEMYDKGLGVPQNDKEAARYFRLAAEQGYSIAQDNLGLMYARGHGLTRNDKEAVKLFRLAAEQGYANAQYNLGVMYALGNGVQRNAKEAYAWFSVAAANGFTQASAEIVDLTTAGLNQSEREDAQDLAMVYFEKYQPKP